MIWLGSIFCSLAMWVAEKIPKLWRKYQPFASDVSANTVRDATLRSVVFSLTPHQCLLTVGFVSRNLSADSTLQNLFHSLFIAYLAKSSIPTLDIALFYLVLQ